jgi:hypothetical protein
MLSGALDLVAMERNQISRTERLRVRAWLQEVDPIGSSFDR